ncbi:MAG: RsmE family RNA methyltransferase, partial [Fervidobacterium sp.]
MRRIYLDPVDCERKHSRIYIKGSSLHYLSNVLRMKEGDVFTGFDGSGYEYEIKITFRDKRFLKGEILKTEKLVDIEIPFNIILFQSLPKGNKIDRIIG